MKRRRFLRFVLLFACLSLPACEILRNEFWTLDVELPPIEATDTLDQ